MRASIVCSTFRSRNRQLKTIQSSTIRSSRLMRQSLPQLPTEVSATRRRTRPTANPAVLVEIFNTRRHRTSIVLSRSIGRRRLSSADRHQHRPPALQNHCCVSPRPSTTLRSMAFHIYWFLRAIRYQLTNGVSCQAITQSLCRQDRPCVYFFRRTVRSRLRARHPPSPSIGRTYYSKLFPTRRCEYFSRRRRLPRRLRLRLRHPRRHRQMHRAHRLVGCC